MFPDHRRQRQFAHHKNKEPQKTFQTPSKIEINAVINSDFNMKTSLSLPETASEAGHHRSHE
jgi:hypothetical protein